MAPTWTGPGLFEFLIITYQLPNFLLLSNELFGENILIQTLIF